MLKILITQVPEVEDLFCGVSSGSEPSLFISNCLYRFGFKPNKDYCQHHSARVTDKSDGIFALAVL